MRDYFKILSSIIAALISLTLLISAIVAVGALLADSSGSASGVLFPFVVAWIGFLMFGVTGSVFWFAALKAMGSLTIGAMKKNAVAACFSTIASWLIPAVIIFRDDLEELPETGFILAPVVPVVACSLLWYWLLYLRPSRNQARQRHR